MQIRHERLDEAQGNLHSLREACPTISPLEALAAGVGGFEAFAAFELRQSNVDPLIERDDLGPASFVELKEQIQCLTDKLADA